MDVASLDLASVDHVLTTTRAVRKRLDLTRPVERDVIERCIEIAIQAPTALYGETWHFVVVTDPTQRAAVAEIYRRAGAGVRAGTVARDPYLTSLQASSPEDQRFIRLVAMCRISNVERNSRVRRRPPKQHRITQSYACGGDLLKSDSVSNPHGHVPQRCADWRAPGSPLFARGEAPACAVSCAGSESLCTRKLSRCLKIPGPPGGESARTTAARGETRPETYDSHASCRPNTD